MASFVDNAGIKDFLRTLLTEDKNNKETLINMIGQIELTPGPAGPAGNDGPDGKSLEFNWNGTQLGVRKEGETEYSYVDLKGKDGSNLSDEELRDIASTAINQAIEDGRISNYDDTEISTKVSGLSSLLSDNLNISIGELKEKTFIHHASGDANTLNPYSATDFIPCRNAYKIKVKVTFSDSAGLAFYDKNKDYISGFGITDTSANPLNSFVVVDVPSNACYLRTCKVWNAEAPEISLVSLVDSVCSVDNSESPLSNIIYHGGMTRIFLKFGCIGDSLSSGEHVSNETGSYAWHDYYEHSWGQYIARICGTECINFSNGGLTTRSWLESEHATNAFTDSSKLCAAYTIALGVNDASRGIPLGSTTDIDTSNYNNNADTYYGNYAKIIQKIKEVQPKAKIFCITNPNPSKLDGVEPYNEAVRYMCETFDNCYLIDLARYDKSIKHDYMMGGHLSTPGYLNSAYVISTYIDWIVRNNLREFAQIPFIGTDHSFTFSN